MLKAELEELHSRGGFFVITSGLRGFIELFLSS
jgi:hypothetical protein